MGTFFRPSIQALTNLSGLYLGRIPEWGLLKYMNTLLTDTKHYALALSIAVNMAAIPGSGLNLPPIGPNILIGEAISSVLSSQALSTSSLQVKSKEAAAVKPAEKTPEAKSKKVTLTAYSSTVDQTDDTPFIAASGKRVYDGMIAANFLPFGTKVMIPELFGDKVFTVHDRMNRRYAERVDIWFAERQDALNFGIRTAEIVIL